MPRFGGAKRLQTGNQQDNNRLRVNEQAMPGTAATEGRMKSLRANSSSKKPGSMDQFDNGPNKINIVAKKRPPPMAIGFNESGIEMSRQVLYRNFH